MRMAVSVRVNVFIFSVVEKYTVQNMNDMVQYTKFRYLEGVFALS